MILLPEQSQNKVNNFNTEEVDDASVLTIFNLINIIKFGGILIQY